MLTWSTKTICIRFRHFYDGFGLQAEVSTRIPALEAFQLQDEDIPPDLVLSPAAVAARGWGGHHEQPVDHNAPELIGAMFPMT